mgnify:CR=1 FL=1
MTSAEFASGKAAWLLNGKNNLLVSQAKWFQNLEENPDAYPVMDGTHEEFIIWKKATLTAIIREVWKKMRFCWCPVHRL